jgi:hypothetical protein
MINFESRSLGTAVIVDGRTGRPREIRSAGERLAITVLEAVRDETSAYPADTGPRTVFVVRSGVRRYRLVHLLDERRWTIEELSPQGTAVTRAA